MIELCDSGPPSLTPANLDGTGAIIGQLLGERTLTIYSPLNWAETFTAVATCTVALTGVAALGIAWRELRQTHKQNQVNTCLNSIGDTVRNLL